MSFAKRPFHAGLLGLLAAPLLGAVHNSRLFELNPFMDFELMPAPRAVRIARSFRYSRPTGSMIQPHTGAGGPGAHRRWKKRRAAGIYHS